VAKDLGHLPRSVFAFDLLAVDTNDHIAGADASFVGGSARAHLDYVRPILAARPVELTRQIRYLVRGLLQSFPSRIELRLTVRVAIAARVLVYMDTRWRWRRWWGQPLRQRSCRQQGTSGHQQCSECSNRFRLHFKLLSVTRRRASPRTGPVPAS